QDRHIKWNTIQFYLKYFNFRNVIAGFKVYRSGSDFISPVHHLNLFNKNSSERRSYIYIFVKLLFWNTLIEFRCLWQSKHHNTPYFTTRKQINSKSSKPEISDISAEVPPPEKRLSISLSSFVSI